MMTFAGAVAVFQAFVWPLIGSFVIPWLLETTKSAKFEKYKRAAEIAAGIAEELAAKEGGWTSQDKMDRAVTELLNLVPQKSFLSKMTRKDAEGLINGILPFLGMGASFKSIEAAPNK